MRKGYLVLAGVVCALGLAGAAKATSVNLLWLGGSSSSGAITGLGTDSVTIAQSAVATLTLDVQLNIDSRGSAGVFISLEFDTDLGNELNVLGWQELAWSNAKGTRTLTQLNVGLSRSQESFTGTQEGQLYTFEGTSTGLGPSATTLTFARVVFVTNHGLVSNDGNDVFSGVFNTGIDDVFDNATPLANKITSSVLFGAASVNVIPEPGTISLLALGLGALLVAGRRRRR